MIYDLQSYNGFSTTRAISLLPDFAIGLAGLHASDGHSGTEVCISSPRPHSAACFARHTITVT